MRSRESSKAFSFATSTEFDPSFGTAYQAVRAVKNGWISATELLDHTIARIRRYNPLIEAFITLDEENARARAKLADDALARGKLWGRLHGLPLLIKDTFETAGLRTTSGSKILENYVPSENALAVARLKAAGAIVIGKTNMSEFASDMQSYNQIAETANNPWDLNRTPGGSTGGGAAALAAGFGFLELGSDIGGSIRSPCHFCGVYGHKPTLNLVPLRGHIPPVPGSWSPEQDLGVAGPMARSAKDLLLELKTITEPAQNECHSYRVQLPEARGTALRDYRIGYMLDDPFCPLSPEVKRSMEDAIDSLRKAGANLVEGWPEGYEAGKAFDLYLILLAASFSDAISAEDRQLMGRNLDSDWGRYARGWLKGCSLSHDEWRTLSGQRMEVRNTWQRYFQSFDAFLLPVNFVPAFPHDQRLSFFERTLRTSAGDRQYGDLLRWISPGTLTGCPVTVSPIGKTQDGLPVGIQIMGPFFEDATPIVLAEILEEVWGGFDSPPGFD